MPYNFSNQTFSINANTRLSLSLWQEGEVWIGSAAIKRLVGKRWVLDEVQDVRAKHTQNDEVNRDNCFAKLTDVGASLAGAEFPEGLPLRFFRDNYLSSFRRH